MKYVFFVLSLASQLLFVTESQAAKRVVYFSSVGRNKVDFGLDNAAGASCTITISNPSQTAQTYTLDSLSITPATAYTLSSTAGTCTGTASTCTLANGESSTYQWDYPTIQNPTTQPIVCGGRITGEDQTATNPGFLVAGGVLVTFLESTFKSTYETTKTSESHQPVFSQTPISVNAGKPF